jgi:hypothetical protein
LEGSGTWPGPDSAVEVDAVGWVVPEGTALSAVVPVCVPEVGDAASDPIDGEPGAVVAGPAGLDDGVVVAARGARLSTRTTTRTAPPAKRKSPAPTPSRIFIIPPDRGTPAGCTTEMPPPVFAA